jgi:SAM-dependent methyltransferase
VKVTKQVNSTSNPVSSSLVRLFEDIYEQRRWGHDRSSGDRFFSGSGSHTPEIVTPYINFVKSFCTYFEVFCGRRPDVLDIGCGDFNIGEKIRPACSGYIACDLVESLIARNRVKFPGVDFRVLDATRDEWPSADVVVIRQVLQHLSNANISRILAQIGSHYKYLILTEHVPLIDSFTPNVDLPDSAGIRVAYGSGIVITKPPFNFQVAAEFLTCAVQEGRGVIRTMLYKL